MPKAPDIAPGRQCSDPVTCEFYERCNLPRPNDHIGYLPRIHASAVEELEEIGVQSIHDIPAEFELTEIQRRAADCVRTGEPWYDSEALKAEPEHFEFLAMDASDPRRDFIESLCAALGENGSIVVYNAAFESQRLLELAAWLPEFADRIKNIQSRLFDLLPIIRNCVYHPAFAGSYSLKSVLPALVPDMSYAGMAVGNGQDAGLAWQSLVHGGLDCDGRGRLRKALLDYCGQDTLALVRLLEALRFASRSDAGTTR
jgi:predicted RecB family nuclease